LEAVALDVYIMRFVAAMVGRGGPASKMSEWTEVLDEWAASFYEEASFASELRNMDEFRSLMQGVQGICVPGSYPALSTSSVLVTEWIDGEKLQAEPCPRARAVCTALLDAYLFQLLESGVMHADPHPGNLLLRPDGSICILDFGLMSRVTPTQQLQLIDFLAHLANDDWALVLRDMQVELGWEG